ncbi:recombination mediator RecR [Thermocrinis minervae]|uniref:Recombination protein RecR n=1 Tax=Thermocrinis minervae TaxID=381751 RepID=A0A1M6T6N4_9AQUI|nr:recombination mediator RecR [Thermocrinis minervae]SHK52657.1 DNA replication and repair protein RecR [Thermocrinis minervae]
MAFEKYFPEILRELLKNIEKIPTYGERGASRLVYNFLKLPKEERLRIANLMMKASESIITCSECGIVSDMDPCRICSDEGRNRRYICVVEESSDAYAIEKLERYKGVYHVLWGRISPLEGISPEDLNIPKLLERVEKNQAKEVILATNPNVEGEATANYLYKLLKRKFPNLTISRVSFGLSFGGFIEFTDSLSLEKSIENRKKL